MEFIDRFFEPPSYNYYLFGPRGTGKSAWTARYYPDAVRIDLLRPDIFRKYHGRPERIIDTVHAEPAGKTIIIDEVQRVPAILSAVHSLIEEKRGWIFVLTGSSSRKLKQTGVDLMAGRAVMRTLHPFMAAELGTEFRLDKALTRGTLPLVLDAGTPQDVLNSYIDIYMREEIQAEGLVRNLEGFSRFLEAISFSHGQVLNISNVARDCEVGRKTVEGYLSILEDLLLCFTIPVFSKRAGRATVRHHKFYIFDSGIYRSLRPAGPLDKPEEIAGPALEGLVAQHLRAWIAYTGNKYSLYYWRTRAGTEVDFIIYGPAMFCAIEVKHGARVHRQNLRGLKAFKDDYPEARTILLYRGSEKHLVDGILCLPCDEFLRVLHPSNPFPFLE